MPADLDPNQSEPASARVTQFSILPIRVIRQENQTLQRGALINPGRTFNTDMGTQLGERSEDTRRRVKKTDLPGPDTNA